MRPESRRPGGRWGHVLLAALLLGATLVAVETRGPEALPSAPLPALASNAATPAAIPALPILLPNGDALATPTATAAPSPTPTATPSPTPVTLASLPAAVDALVTAAPAEVGAVIALPDGTVLYQHDPDRVFEAASLYKLGIMAEVYRQREAGKITFDEPLTLYAGFFDEGDDVYTVANNLGTSVPLGEALRYMVEYSSNVAAKALLYVVGTGNVNSTLASLGLTSTELRWAPHAEAAPRLMLASTGAGRGSSAASPADATNALDVTSAADMARFFELLLQGKVISAQASSEMLDLLSQQQVNDRLPARLPAGTRVAHKTGNLVGVVHDAGIIFAPKGPVVVVLLSDNVGDEGLVDDMMQRVARFAFEARS